ncbi:13103_t:CDS:2, partial [Dentiscutata erythropus]
KNKNVDKVYNSEKGLLCAYQKLKISEENLGEIEIIILNSPPSDDDKKKIYGN